jgi:aryl-alcohol dehydrogenase-like predicted oxidoreductase
MPDNQKKNASSTKIDQHRIGLGCMGMSAFYGATDEEACIRALHEAFRLGYRLFDTADMYGNGANERLLGRFLRELGAQRNELLLATKVGLKLVQGPPPSITADSSRAYVKAACDESLKRLGVDEIGLLYLHRKTPDVAIEETVGAMMELVAAGKVRQIGLSEVSDATLERACRVAPIAALQSEYSLWTRDVENTTLALCKRLGVAFVAYSPLGRGFLTGTFKKPETPGDLRSMLPRFQEANFEANMALVETVREIAHELSCLPSQVALAWVLAMDENVRVIPGTTSLKNLAVNIGSLDVRLSADQLQRLSTTFSKEAIRGERYPAPIMTTVNI